MISNVRYYHVCPNRSSEKSSEQSSTLTTSNTSTNSFAVATIKGTIYVYTLETGQILQDRRFEFAKRLKDENGNPIHIEKDDIYLSLGGQIEKIGNFWNTEFHFRDKISLPNDRLPISLFENIKEGGTVRFYYDDQLVELLCKQAAFPNNQEARFERCLAEVKTRVNPFFDTPLFKEDFDEAELMDHLPFSNIYKEDQEKHGAYNKIGVLYWNTNTIIFDLEWYYRVNISEIELILPDELSGLQRYWILIRHKPEENQFPKDCHSTTETYGDGTERTFTKNYFNPQKGDRRALYHHGQYFTFLLRDVKDVKLFFNKQGYLQLSMTKSSQSDQILI